MPHDKFGQMLEVGDEILVRATVREITTGADFCNVKIETVEKMDVSRTAGETVWLNSKQVEKLVPSHLRAIPSQDAPVGPQDSK